MARKPWIPPEGTFLPTKKEAIALGLEKFWRPYGSKPGGWWANVEKHERSNKKFYSQFPRGSAGYATLIHYGITPQERDAILAEQGGVCKCCGASDPGSKVGWHIDHVHQSKEDTRYFRRFGFKCRAVIIRGVVCHACNVMIGFAEDRIYRLEKGISYLINSSLLHLGPSTEHKTPLKTQVEEFDLPGGPGSRSPL